MIEKFINIRNIGKFTDYQASGDVTLTPVTVIFGENGRGKSTLATILRSLKTQNPIHINVKRTLGAKGKILVKINFKDEGVITYKDDTWDKEYPNIEVFDSTFVNENIYSGDIVDSDHRSNLYQLVIGEQGVDLAQEIKELDIVIRGLSNNKKQIETEILKYTIGRITVEEFIKLNEVADINLLIENKKEEIKAIEQLDEIIEKPLFNKFDFPEIKFEDIGVLLNKTLDDISSQAEKQVRNHCDHFGPKSESWVKQGTDLMKHDDNCPFCGQTISGVELIKEFKNYFSKNYQEFKKELSNKLQSVEDSIGQSFQLSIQRKFGANGVNNEFWKNFIEYKPPILDDKKLNEQIQEFLESFRMLFQEKLTNPLDVLKSPEQIDDLSAAYSRIKNDIKLLNQSLEVLNQKILNKKNDSEKGDILKTTAELEKLENIEIRYSIPVNSLCDRFADNSTRHEEKTELKRKKRADLDSFSDKLLATYQKGINLFLERFSTSIRIVETKTTHQGGSPKTIYSLSLNGEIVPLALKKSDTEDQPSFRTTLSDGEKNALAFAFFLALLEQDKNINKKIIIIDDPITSLDKPRKISTQQEITGLTKKAKQVIVLSHDAQFLYEIKDKSYLGNVKCLKVKRENINNSKIIFWEIHEDVQSNYTKDYYELVNYLENGSDNIRSVVRSIRPVLEGYLVMKYPLHFKVGDTLGKMLEKISLELDNSKPLFRMHSHLEELNKIKEYANRYHHNLSSSENAEPISEGELQSYVSRTLSLHTKL